MRKFILIFLFLYLLTSCGSGDKYRFTIKGRLSDSNNERVLVYEISPDKLIPLDSVKPDDNGVFRLKISGNISPQLFMLKVKDYPGRINLLLTDGETAVVKGDALYLDKTYSVSGSPGSEKIRMLNHRLNQYIRQGDSIYTAFRKAPAFLSRDSLRAAADTAMLQLFDRVHRFSVDFCLQNKTSLAAIPGLYSRYGNEAILTPEADFEVFEEVAAALQKSLPGNPHVTALAQRVKKIQLQRELKKEREEALSPGKPAPDLLLRNPPLTPPPPLCPPRPMLVATWAALSRPRPKIRMAYRREDQCHITTCFSNSVMINNNDS